MLRFVFELGVRHGEAMGLLRERLEVLTAENFRITTEFSDRLAIEREISCTQADLAERLAKRVADFETGIAR